MTPLSIQRSFSYAIIFSIFCSCTDKTTSTIGYNIATAQKVSIDRFSESAGNLMVRTSTNGLPGINEAINFDIQPFNTTGLDRTGAVVRYYNFDVKSTLPANIYVFFKSGAANPVEGQNNILGVIPGDAGYNDFWLVNKVTVPQNYVPNSVTSLDAVLSSGYPVSKTSSIVNCPVIPFGSTATRSSTPSQQSEITLGWYKDKAVGYFNFTEASIAATADGMVPSSTIYVMFNDNSTGPLSGFKTESVESLQSHNVLATLPGDQEYSPLWNVLVLDNKNFGAVTNLQTASSFPSTPSSGAVNCPVVK